MMRNSRRSGVVAVLVLSLCATMTGCLSTGSDQPVVRGAGGAMPGQRMPPGPFMAGPNANIKPMSYAQPQGDMVIEQGPMMLQEGMVMASPPLPGELKMTSLPPHRVAPPDILLIEALKLIPKGPYLLEPMEALHIEATETDPQHPIKGLFMISPEGEIDLGIRYGTVRIMGMTLEKARAEIYAKLAKNLTAFAEKRLSARVSVTLVQMRALQNIKGEHLVRPDGTVHLGLYGSVYVAGMTLGQVKCVIENHLAAYLVNPQVSVDVRAYNSRKVFVIADGAGLGQHVIAVPVTGNETVLDVISRLQGGSKQIPDWSSTKKIWVARPSPAGNACSQVLPVDWRAITQGARPETNYQLFPGDRIYIEGDCFITMYNRIDKFLAPIERVLNFALLGSTTFQSLRGNNNGGLILAP